MNKKYILTGVGVIILLVLVIGGGIWFSRTEETPSEESPEAEEVEEVTEATETPEEPVEIETATTTEVIETETEIIESEE